MLVNVRFFSIILCILTGCNSNLERLPVLGEVQEINGKKVYHTIPSFTFINQDSQLITGHTFKEKVYVADFFFTSCPTICPKMAQQMLRLYHHFEGEARVLFLSHSIDTKYDTVDQLKNYATQLGVNDSRWHFVTGEKEALYAIAEDYFNVVFEDDSAPGGYNHTGRFILIDEQKRIRSYCNGVSPSEVDEFILNIEKLLSERAHKG